MMATVGMIATGDRILVGLSVIVITLTLWPSPPARQSITWQDSSGMVRNYSLPVDDPRIAMLAARVADWGKCKPSPRLFVAKWRKELADFYAQQLAEQKERKDSADQVVQASFVAKSDASPSAHPEALNPATQRYWIQASEWASRQIAEQQRLTAERERALGHPPVVLGEVIPGKMPLSAIATGLVSGLLAAIAFGIWQRCFPKITLGAPTEIDRQMMPDDFQNLIRVEIPAAWVKLHQPKSVWLQRTVCVALVMVAITCSLL